jgi:hypothetical protein
LGIEFFPLFYYASQSFMIYKRKNELSFISNHPPSSSFRDAIANGSLCSFSLFFQKIPPLHAVGYAVEKKAITTT